MRQIYGSAEARYVPTTLSIGSVVLVRARFGEGGDTPFRHIYADESFGWASLAHDLTIVDVDGGHFSMLQEDFVDSLAEALEPYVVPKKTATVCGRGIEISRCMTIRARQRLPPIDMHWRAIRSVRTRESNEAFGGYCKLSRRASYD